MIMGIDFLELSISKLGPNTKFVVVGAMDGIAHDNLYPYLISNPNWKGTFVEPVREYFDQLVINFDGFGHFNFVNAALTENTGTAEITRLPKHLIGNELPIWADGISTLKTDPGMTVFNFGQYAFQETVNTLSVRDFLTQQSINDIDLLQIDCEGYDYYIFFQFWELGFRPQVIKVEKVFFNQTEQDYMVDLLQSTGYTVGLVGDDIMAFR